MKICGKYKKFKTKKEERSVRLDAEIKKQRIGSYD
jgi:hypothetical protein